MAMSNEPIFPIDEEEVIAEAVLTTLARHGFTDHLVIGELVRAITEALNLHRLSTP